MNQLPNDKLLRLPEVLDRIRVSRSTLYSWIAQGKFPSGSKLGERMRVWRCSEIDYLVASMKSSNWREER